MDRSFRLFKERNCTVAVALDTRSQGKQGKEFPVALRFTVDRKVFYLPVGGSYSEKQFSDICRAKRCTVPSSATKPVNIRHPPSAQVQ